MSELPDGHYDLKIASDKIETVQPLQIKEERVIVKEYLREIFFAPTIRLQNRQLDVNWLGNQLDNLKMDFVDANGNLVFSDEAKQVHKLARRYQLGHLKAGTYTIRIKTGSHSYSERFTLK